VYQTDRLGSVRALTNGSGAVSASYQTDEWGVPTVTTGGSAQPFGFTGEPRDGTGLTYLRSRYYDPDLGRFVTRDTWPGVASSPQTLNRYAYANNNPTTNTDPSGRYVETVVDIAFILYDIGSLVFGPPKDRGGNWAALGADIVGAGVPFVTGLGIAARAGIKTVGTGGKILEGAGAIRAAAKKFGVDYEKLNEWIHRSLKKGLLGPADNVRFLPNGDIVPPIGDEVLGNVYDVLE